MELGTQYSTCMHTSAGGWAATPHPQAVDLQTLTKALSSECEASVTLVGGE